MDSMEGMEHGGSSPTSSETLTAELRDGQLQIVEVSGPFDKDDEDVDDVTETLQIGQDDGSKYVQVLNADGKGLLHLDLMNLTFVRCQDGDGDESYRLVTNAEEMEGGSEHTYITPDTVQVKVLQTSEEENDEQETDGESYVMVEGETFAEQEDAPAEESFVMIQGEDGPVFYLESDLKQTNAVCKQVKGKQAKFKPEAPETPLEMLQKAKALLKAKVLLSKSMAPHTGRGRRPKHNLPTPDEILSSPSFKLFLYSCKMCNFRCNAVRELTRHRVQCHGAAPRGKLRPAPAQLQCARCPFRGGSHLLLMRHVQDHHLNTQSSSELEATISAADAEILVCGACGLESSDRNAFRAHLRDHALD